MRLHVDLKRYLTAFASVVAAQSVFLYTSFFANLNSTLSEWSAFGIIWPMQLIHNFMNGRPFQSSLYAGPLGGISLGYVANPHDYIHANVIHANFFPYLFAYPWSLHPTLAWWYGIIILWNVVGGLWLTRLILKRLSPDGCRAKTVFAFAVFLGSGLLSVMDQFAQFTLFAGPLLMAVYYFFLTKRRWAFLAAVAALCLTGEDTAMAAVSFMAYLFLFERDEDGRSYGVAGAAFAIPYLLLILLVVQPASRAELTLLSATNMSNVIKHFFEVTPDTLARNFKTLWALFTLLPAFLIAGPLFGRPAKDQAVRIAGLVFVSTAPFWGECFARGGGHHLMPPFTSTYLGLLLMLAYGKAADKPERRVPGLALAATAIFLLFSWRVQANLLPNAMKPALYRLSGKADKAAALELSLKVEQASNREVIAAAKAIPPEKSLAYLVNNRTVGFIVDRSDIWQCTDVLQGRFAFDETDYYLIQNDAVDMACCFRAERGADYRAVVANAGDRDVSDLNCPMTPALREKIMDTLVRPGTHRIVRDDEHVLLLENLHPRRFESHPTTLGFGWTRNLSKRGKIVAPPPALR